MTNPSFPQRYSSFGLDLALAQVRNIRQSLYNDDSRLGLAEQSIEAALHWLSQPPMVHEPTEPNQKKRA